MTSGSRDDAGSIGIQIVTRIGLFALVGNDCNY